MLKKPSKEWDNYMKRLNAIKRKSNREVLCTECWMILNYEQRGKHSSKFPKHKDSILTSSQFASEIQFYHIAFTHNKVIEKPNDVKLVIQPCLFDPKKGSGHMKMIEELCREMHVTKSDTFDCEDDDNVDSITNQIQLQDTVNNHSAKDIPEVPTNEAEELRLNQVDKCLDTMIQSLSDFEQCVYSQLYWNTQSYPTNYLPVSQGVQLEQAAYKRRKTSENDSFYNYQSAESTLHPNTSSEEMRYYMAQQNLAELVDYKAYANYSSAFPSPVSMPRLTAFSPYAPAVGAKGQ